MKNNQTWIERQEDIDKEIISLVHYAMQAKRDYDVHINRINELTKEYSRLTSDNIPF